jgi:hypothetical protein
MSILHLLTFAVVLLQTGDPSSGPADIFVPSEKTRIEKSQNVDGRIKVYETASNRIQQELEAAVTKEDFQKVPDSLRTWSSLLSKSLEDIESNVKAKKKSRALINYEIQVRKSITRTESLKIRAPVEQQDLFDSCLEQAENVRRRFVEILFRH